MANKVYEIITQRIIDELEKGIIPWQKPWKAAGHNTNNMFPCYSYSTGKRYDFINQMLLDFVPGDYVTFEQCKKAGGKVKKGAKSKVICGWVVTKTQVKDLKGEVILNEDGEPEEKTNFGLRYYQVFHINDTEGLKAKHTFEVVEEVEEENTVEPNEAAEAIIKGYLSREANLQFVNEKGNEAYYAPLFDKVVVPEPVQFKRPEEYYSTAFHELTHSTMKKSRCDRETDRKGKNVAFGSETYSKEELVAEIGSAILVNVAGLETEHSFRNSAAYIQNWLTALKNDTSMVIMASIKADKAVQYILGENE